MTTTVIVKSRGRGATVETNGETIELQPHEDRTFHISEGSQSFTVTQPEDEQSQGFVDPATGTDSAQVPGRDENDQLLGQGAAGKRKASPATGNQSGATEAAQTTEG